MKGKGSLLRWFWPLVAVAVLVALPAILPRYQLRLVNEALIFSLFAVSYNLLLGYAGLLSFGHAMFFGVGAYTTGLLAGKGAAMPFFGALALATLVTTLVGFAVGVLLLRVRGTPFALLTLAFNALFYAIAIKWSDLTGGDDGLKLFRPAIDVGITQLNTNAHSVFYYITLLVVGVTLLYCWYFTRTSMGRTVLLMRENEERLRFVGYNTSVSRLILFTFTGSLAGMAGSFYALFFSFVSLEAISIDMTTRVLLMTFIGGTGHFLGPVLGAGVYIYLQDFLSDLTDRWPLIMGVLFILIVLFAPGGLSGIIRSATGFFVRQDNAKG
ncbi:MAG: branched-chain amino acid ABC transporter permease [Deltaproteobacteria bacterium]|nr:branched-chain amino acid ABC transporter permease [Deltaproteobacteria bacterium]